MNSTEGGPANTEKEKILEVSTGIGKSGACSEVLGAGTPEVESYYCDRADAKLFPSEVFRYDFQTPAELRAMLQQMWEYQGCGYMKEYAVVAVISTFRYKAEKCVETGIPAFIYQF